MIPADHPRHAAGREDGRGSRQRGQARTSWQAPAPPGRPARPVRLQFSRGLIPATPGAACASHDPGLWFSDSPQDIAQAKAICRRCPDQAPCLAGAMRRRETCGIWGGTDLNPAHHQEDAA